MSTATVVHIVRESDANGVKRLFGGQLMTWIDVTGAVAARRHAQCNVMTAAVDNLTFLHPAKVNDTVVLKAQVTWTGRTSMEVRVETYVEPLKGDRHLINVAYLVFVSVCDGGSPTPVKPFVPKTAAEKKEWELAVARKTVRDANRARLPKP